MPPSFIVNSLHLFMNLNCCLMQNNGSTLLYLLVSSGTFFKTHTLYFICLFNQNNYTCFYSLGSKEIASCNANKEFSIRGILLTYVLHFKPTYYAFIVLLFFDVSERIKVGWKVWKGLVYSNKMNLFNQLYRRDQSLSHQLEFII